CWESGNTDVHLPVLEAEPDASVLRHTTLRDIQFGHDLEAADDRCCQMSGRGRGFLEHSVNPVSNPDPRLISLEVHVRGACLERFNEEQVHQPDYRCFIGEMQEIIEWQLAIFGAPAIPCESGNEILRSECLFTVRSTDGRAGFLLRLPHELNARIEK